MKCRRSITRGVSSFTIRWKVDDFPTLCGAVCLLSSCSEAGDLLRRLYSGSSVCIHAEKRVIRLSLWRSLNSVIIHQLLFLGSTYSGPVGETPNSLSELNTVRSSLEVSEFLTSDLLCMFYYAWAGLWRPTSLLKIYTWDTICGVLLTKTVRIDINIFYLQLLRATWQDVQ